MIVIQLSGGLGNQMFQYALYKKLKTLGRDVYIDDATAYPADGSWNTAGVSKRSPMLDLFGIRYERAGADMIRDLTDSHMDPPSRIRRKLKGRHSLERKDEDLVFDPWFLTADTGYFTGCFQSGRYFEGIEDQLKSEFGRERLEYFAGRMAEKAGADRVPAAVHLRFGDYLNDPGQYGNICTDDYYRAAVGRIWKEVTEKENRRPLFFVFSNDHKLAAEWIERNFGNTGPYGCTAADFRTEGAGDEEHPLDDLLAMAACRHHITANSSYSWWASFLGQSKGQIVTAPSVWLHKEDGSGIRRTDIFRDEMIRISPSGKVLGAAGAREYAPLVSVIIPAHNVEKYIARSVSSLLSQTYTNIEVIVVDDGSSDSTGHTADLLAGRDNRVKVVHQENAGVSAARNRGIDEAKGEYIGFMDSDDAADPDMIGRMLDACLYADVPVSIIPYRIAALADVEKEGPAVIDGKKAVQDHNGDLSGARILSREQALRAYAAEDESISICNSVWNKLFKRELTEGIRFEKHRESEDILFTTKALLKADRAAYIDRPMYIYTADRSGSIMNAHTGRRRIDDEIPFWKEQMELYRQNGLEEIEEEAFYGFCRRMLFYDLDFRRNTGMEEYAKALEKEVRSLSDRIRTVYSRPFVKTGDRARMAVFLFSPRLYERLDRIRSRI